MPYLSLELRPFIAGLGIALGAVIAASASADAEADKREAHKHFETGLELSDDKIKDYEGALVEFQVSVKLFPTKAGLFNLGVCLRKLARYGEALEVFSRIKTEYGDSLDRQMRDAVDKELETIRRITAELVISVDPAGATIRLDGALVGKSPLDEPLVLGPRKYLIRVEAVGYKSVERAITLVTGQRREEAFELVAVSAWVSIDSGEVEGVSVVVDDREVGTTPQDSPLRLEPGPHVISVAKEGYKPVPPQEVELRAGARPTLTFDLARIVLPEPDPIVATVAEPIDDRPRLTPLFWAGLGLTAAAGAAAGVFWGLTSARSDQYDELGQEFAALDSNQPGYTSAAQDKLDEMSAVRDEGTMFNRWAIGMTATAGLLAAVTVVGLVVGGPGEEEARGDPSAQLLPAPGGVAVRF
jgi:hypothetical protein